MRWYIKIKKKRAGLWRQNSRTTRKRKAEVKDRLTSLEEKVKAWECPEREGSETWPTMLEHFAGEPMLWNQGMKKKTMLLQIGCMLTHTRVLFFKIRFLWAIFTDVCRSESSDRAGQDCVEGKPAIFSYLAPSTSGGQVRQAAAGHRAESLPASLSLHLLFSPSLSKPGERQAWRHGGYWTRRRDFRRPVHQVTRTPGRKQWLRSNQKRDNFSNSIKLSEKKKKKSHFALRFHLLLRDLLESFSLLLLLRDFRRPLKRRSRPVIKKLQEQVPRLSRLSRQIFKMCDSRQETLAFKPGKRRDRDPAPEVGEFLFGLSGCRGFARRGRDPVSGVVGRWEDEAVGGLRADVRERRHTGQVTSAAPLRGRRGRRQR